MVVGVGPPATQNREPGQAWKGAAAAVEAGAGVWLAQAAAPHLGSAIRRSRWIIAGYWITVLAVRAGHASVKLRPNHCSIRLCPHRA